MAQLNTAMNYTFYFYFRGFSFSAGYFTCANHSDSMSFCEERAAEEEKKGPISRYSKGELIDELSFFDFR